MQPNYYFHQLLLRNTLYLCISTGQRSSKCFITAGEISARNFHIWHVWVCSQRWGTKRDISLYKRCSFKTMTCTIMPFYVIILCTFRKLLKSADTLFCGAFWKYLQKYVLDVTGHRCPMLHPQQLF